MNDIIILAPLCSWVTQTIPRGLSTMFCSDLPENHRQVRAGPASHSVAYTDPCGHSPRAVLQELASVFLLGNAGASVKYPPPDAVSASPTPEPFV